MTQELVGVAPGTEEEVRHTINVDAEALVLRNVADDMFAEGKPFSPMMVYFRKNAKIAAAVCRPWANERDRDVAYTELGMLIPCFRADEVVFAFPAYLVKASETQKGHMAVAVFAANKIGLTMRTFPYFTDENNVFTQWTEEGSDIANYDPFVSSMLGGYMAYEKRPYLLSTIITTMHRVGHTVELFIKDVEGLADAINS